MKMIKRFVRGVLRGCIVKNAMSLVYGVSFDRESWAMDESINLIVNGPSLSESIDEISASGRPCMVVNHFADSDYFNCLRPRYYVIQDSYFWQQGALPLYDEKRKNTYKAITEKVKWPIIIFIPSFADASYVRKQILNDNVKILIYNARYFNECCGELRSYLKPKKWLFYLWRKNILAPPPENVLVGASYVSFLGGVKEAFLYGADMSVFKGLEVDQETNEVLISEPRFYSTESRPSFKDKLGNTPTTMSHELEKWAKVFKAISILNEFYEDNSFKIINRSKQSYLDMFCRSLN